MKKILYGTTALVAAGMISSAAFAADPIKLTVGGHMWQFFGMGDMDESEGNSGSTTSLADTNNFGVASDVEVYFKGETKLDNGLTVGAVIELEAERTSGTPNGRNADQQYAYIKGAFGEISAGDRIIVQNAIHNNAPAFGIDFHNTRLYFIPETFFGGNASTTAANNTGAFVAAPYGEHRTDFDGLINRGNTKLQYVTPVLFGGFTGALIYVPTVANGNGGRGMTNENTTSHDAMGAAVAYKGKVFGVDVGTDVGYARMQRSNNAATIGNGGAVSAVSGGLVLGYAGFKVGASGMRVYDDIRTSIAGAAAQTAAVTSLDGYTYDAGVSYEWGNWGVSYTYFNATVEGIIQNAAAAATNGTSPNGKDKTEFHKGAVMYKMGPGVVVDAALIYGEYANEGGQRADASTLNQAQTVNGYALVGGLRLAF